jgi:hypothetical protein
MNKYNRWQNFLLFAYKKKKEDNCALEILREKKIYIFLDLPLKSANFYVFNTFIFTSMHVTQLMQ